MSFREQHHHLITIITFTSNFLDKRTTVVFHTQTSPESYLILSVQIILPAIPLPPSVIVRTCSVGGVADRGQMVWCSSNRMKRCVFFWCIFLFIGGGGGQSRWEGGDETCPVSPPTKRPGFHCYAPIPLPGSPWQQSNDEGSQKINRWRVHNTEQKMSELLPVTFFNLIQDGNRTNHVAHIKQLVGDMMCFKCCSFVRSSYSCAQQPSCCNPTSWEAGKMNGDNLHQIFWWQWEQDVPLPAFQWLIPCGSRTGSRPIFSPTWSKEGFWLF